jgi:hypothetical protein
MLRLAFAALRHRKLRSALAILSTAICICIVTTVSAIHYRMESLVSLSQERQLNTFPMWDGMPIPIEVVDKMKQHLPPGAERVVRIVGASANDGKGYRFLLMAGDEDYIDAHMPEGWYVVDPQVRARWQAEPDGLIAHATTMKVMGWHVGDQVLVRSDHGEFALRISGQATGKSAGNSLMHYSYYDDLQRKRGRPVGMVDNVRTFLAPGAKVADVAEAIDHTMAEAGIPTVSMTRNEMHRFQRKSAGPLLGFLTGISILVLVVTGFISTTGLSMSLGERKGDFASLRAIGFSRRRVSRLVVLEAVVQTLLGGLIGCAVPFVLLRSGLHLGVLFLNDVHIGAPAILIGLGFSVLLGVVSSLPLALIAFRGTALDLRD